MQTIEKRLLFIADRRAAYLPLNYMLAPFPLTLGAGKLDIINGRHSERTFMLKSTQNSRAKKSYFYKSISRYELQI